MAKKKATKKKVVKKVSRKAPARKSSKGKGSGRKTARSNARQKPWTPNPGQKAVLERLKVCPYIRPACEKIGISAGHFYIAMREHPDFAEAVEEARTLGFQRAEAEAHRLAMEGDEEYVVAGGKVVMKTHDDAGAELEVPIPLKRRKRSERLMELILKGNLKEKYGTNRTEVTGKDGGPVESRDVGPDYSKLSDDELKTLIRLQSIAEGRDT